jgi:hypothetical protein
MVDAEEQALFQEIIARLAFEALNVAVLHWLAGS